MSRDGAARRAATTFACVLVAASAVVACDGEGRAKPEGDGATMPGGMGGDAPPKPVSPSSQTPLTAPDVPGVPLPRPTGPWPVFTDVTKGSGLEAFTLHAGVRAPKNWLLESVGGGLIAFDADGDGDMDLLLPDGDGMTDQGDIVDEPGSGARLFRNDGGFRFTDVTAASGVGVVSGYALGGAACDYDGDGDQDVCVTGYGVFHLLRNDGKGVFEDVTKAAGIDWPPLTTTSTVAWADLDGDGRPDLYVANYSDQRALIERTKAEKKTTPKWCEWRGHRVFCGPRGLVRTPNRLLLQTSAGRFTDATATHLKEEPQHSLQPVISDFDNDGDLDVYVANDSVENTFLVNDGRGHLTDRAVEAGVATGANFVVQGSMGNTVADVDRDGRMDIAITNFAHEYNALYRNKTRPGGPPVFEDVSIATKFSVPASPRVCWGVAVRDFDADGDLDAFIAAGHVYIEEEHDPISKVKYLQLNEMLRGVTGPPDAQGRVRITFEDVSATSGPHFSTPGSWRGAVFPDLDDDGDSDIVVMNQHMPPALLRNDGGNRNSWVRFDLRGRAPNTSAAGARVSVQLTDGSIRTQDVLLGSSYASGDDPRLIFGLGTAQRIAKAVVRWPDGTTTVLADLEVRKTHVVRQ